MTTSLDLAIERSKRRVEAEKAARAPVVKPPPQQSIEDQAMINADREAVQKRIAEQVTKA